MEEILHQLIGSLSHYLQGFKHSSRISSINSSTVFHNGDTPKAFIAVLDICVFLPNPNAFLTHHSLAENAATKTFVIFWTKGEHWKNPPRNKLFLRELTHPHLGKRETHLQKYFWNGISYFPGEYISKVLLTAFASTGKTPMALLTAKISIGCILANHLNGLAVIPVGGMACLGSW